VLAGTGRVSVPASRMQMNTASSRLTVARSLAWGNWGEKPMKRAGIRVRAASYRQIDSSAVDGLTAAATTSVGVPVGQVRATFVNDHGILPGG
jgi:hypothetical protein